MADFPIGALGTCLERQICRGGIGRQIFNKLLQKKIKNNKQVFHNSENLLKNFFLNLSNFFFLQKLCTYLPTIKNYRGSKKEDCINCYGKKVLCYKL